MLDAGLWMLERGGRDTRSHPVSSIKHPVSLCVYSFAR